MHADERALVSTQLRQIAAEAGVDMSPERLERLTTLLQTAVDGARAAAQLVPADAVPAFVTHIAVEAGSD